MGIKQIMTGAAVASLAIMPVAASAADAGKLSVASSVRAAAPAQNASRQDEEGTGADGTIVAVVAAAAVIGGIVVVATENDDDPDSI